MAGRRCSLRWPLRAHARLVHPPHPLGLLRHGSAVPVVEGVGVGWSSRWGAQRVAGEIVLCLLFAPCLSRFLPPCRSDREVAADDGHTARTPLTFQRASDAGRPNTTVGFARCPLTLAGLLSRKSAEPSQPCMGHGSCSYATHGHGHGHGHGHVDMDMDMDVDTWDRGGSWSGIGRGAVGMEGHTSGGWWVNGEAHTSIWNGKRGLGDDLHHLEPSSWPRATVHRLHLALHH